MPASKGLIDIAARRKALEKQKKSEQYLSRYLLAHFQKLGNVKRDLKRLPQDKEFFFLHSDKSFNAFTFIPFVGELHHIKHMYACTYSLAASVVDAFIEMHDTGMISSMTLLISDSMIQRNPTTINYLKSMAATRPNVKVQFAWTHAKITLLDTDNGQYVIEGSGNWSNNAAVEQYLFARDSDLYRFRESLFKEIEIRHEF